MVLSDPVQSPTEMSPGMLQAACIRSTLADLLDSPNVPATQATCQKDSKTFQRLIDPRLIACTYRQRNGEGHLSARTVEAVATAITSNLSNNIPALDWAKPFRRLIDLSHSGA